MTGASTARYAVGIVGNVISFGLFLSPVPTFVRIFKKKDVEEFQFWPYVATVLNCLLWVWYGLPFVTPDSILVVTINGIGLVIELIYLGIFMVYDRQGKGRRKVLLCLLGEAIFMVIIIVVSMLAFHTHKKRSLFVGIFCDIFNIIMYSSPLAIWKKVITTKSVEFMPFWLSLANFSNGCIWTAYALIKLDIYILVSNGLGAIAGFIQLMLYACYYKSTPKRGEDDDPVKPAVEIQMSGSNAASRV